MLACGAMLVLLAGLSSMALANAATVRPARVSNQIQPQRMRIKPHGYYHHTSVFGLRWSGWGQATATATGTFTFQFCVEESCSVSPTFVDPATVALSGLRRCRGRLSYTRLALHVEGLLPDTNFSGFHARLAGSCRG